MQDLDAIGVGSSIDGAAVRSDFASAAEPITTYLSTLLGPWGTYKLTVESEYGDPIVTQDAVRALRPVALDHPIVRLLYGVASDQRRSIGDGAVTATLLCGEVVRRCVDLADERGIHPRSIERGLDVAGTVARTVVDETRQPLALPADSHGQIEAGDGPSDRYRGTVRTAVASRFLDRQDHYVPLVERTVDALARDARQTPNGIAISVDDRTHVLARKGRSRDDSQVFDGVLIEKEVLNLHRKRVEDARVAVVDQKLYLETITDEDETALRATVTTPDELDALRAAADRIHERLTRPLLDMGTTALITRKGIDDRIADALQAAGVLVVRRAKPETVLESVAAATGGTVVGDVTTITPEDLGHAGVVEERRLGDLEFTLIGDCQDAAAVSVLTQAGTWLGSEDVEQSLEVVLDGVAAGLYEGSCVPGGGALEVQIASQLRERATAAGGRHALAIEAVADAFEAVVGALAENCGLDRLDTLAALRAAPGDETRGIVVTESARGVGDVTEAGIYDPTRAKRSAFDAAIEAAGYALTVDQVVFTGRT